jgi:hypothetical protein
VASCSFSSQGSTPSAHAFLHICVDPRMYSLLWKGLDDFAARYVLSLLCYKFRGYLSVECKSSLSFGYNF